MKASVKHHCIICDSLQFAPEVSLEPSYPVFIDPEQNSGFVSRPESLTESQLVRFLVHDPQLRCLLTQKFDVDERSCILLEVRDPIVAPNSDAKPGDIDILIGNREDPRRSIAVQVKQVKVTATGDDTDKVNKLTELGSGAQQANATMQLGFHQTYLMVIAQVDGQAQSGQIPILRTTSDETFRKTYEFDYRERLDPNVGLIFMEVVRPTSKPLDTIYRVCIGIDKPAERMEQPEPLTRRLMDTFTDRHLHARYCNSCDHDGIS